ncbi:MAG: hypothetical protein D6835_05745 [Candidatus Thermofonsia bacterium]|nr:MAG: hypothetical protein D6835_05745 [Candidatus Thermofonsia bacterium]
MRFVLTNLEFAFLDDSPTFLPVNVRFVLAEDKNFVYGWQLAGIRLVQSLRLNQSVFMPGSGQGRVKLPC